MCQRIIRKFEDVGAISKKTAVQFTAANLDLQEEFWLPYFGGSFISSIQKPAGQLYYFKG